MGMGANTRADELESANAAVVTSCRATSAATPRVKS